MKNIDKVIAINERNIATAIGDYTRNTYTKGNLVHLSDAFIRRLACDATEAKTALRGIFRKHESWDEELQAVVINGDVTHDPDPVRISTLVDKVTTPYYDKVAGTGKLADFLAACYFFSDFNCKDVSDALKKDRLEALNRIAPNAYRKGRKLSRVFRDFAKAIGVFDAEAGSQFQRLYAQLADELSGRKLPFTLYISINPAHILTASNPIDDTRGTTLISCHSLNRTDYSYGAGNIGYARDNVTFIVFTASDPKNPETLNNRKTGRQFNFHEVGNPFILHSRLYDTHGGTCGQNDIADFYRDQIQRVIAHGEGWDNLWVPCNYTNNKYGIRCDSADGFGGYADWYEFNGETIKLSVLKSAVNSSLYGFDIGAPGLCLNCGEETYGDNYLCDGCDDMTTCEHCGCHMYEDDAIAAYDTYGDRVYVCEDCLERFYYRCEECGEYHHYDDCTEVNDGVWVCQSCLEESYTQCDDCGRWCHNDYIYRAFKDGNTWRAERAVCEDCFNDHYGYCSFCCDDYHIDNLHRAFIDGEEVDVCDVCIETNKLTQCKDCGAYCDEASLHNGYCPDCAHEHEEKETEEK